MKNQDDTYLNQPVNENYPSRTRRNTLIRELQKQKQSVFPLFTLQHASYASSYIGEFQGKIKGRTLR